MAAEDSGYWYADVAGAKAGDEYRFLIHNGDGGALAHRPLRPRGHELRRQRIVVDPTLDWEGDGFEARVERARHLRDAHRHVQPSGRGNGRARSPTRSSKLEHLKRLGVNAIQIMPATEFAGDFSWGYNPAHIFAVESAYGGPDGLQAFVEAAHAAGIAVILDVVYNHFGPSDLDLWQFDGWSENDAGGIYFYNDWRSETPWGNTRPDYGRGEVRQFIRDNALMWLEEYHVDGLRFDMTLYIRSVRGDEATPATRWRTAGACCSGSTARSPTHFPDASRSPRTCSNNAWLTAEVEDGGAGFGAQWDARLRPPDPRGADRAATTRRGTWRRSPTRSRITTTAMPSSASSTASPTTRWRTARRASPRDRPGRSPHLAAQKRSTLGAALVFTAPGIPMLFQGQEFLQGGWFQDTVPLDWDQSETSAASSGSIAT